MNSVANNVISPTSILLKYSGGVTTDVVDSLLNLVLHRLEDIEENISVRKRVFSVLMECSQNLSLHIDNRTNNQELRVANGYISLEGDFDSYQITSANFVENEKLQSLINELENINHQETPDDLKRLYNKVITNSRYSTKGGGGLGLIDVARKSSGKLNYSFNTVNNTYSFFTLNVTIKKH